LIFRHNPTSGIAAIQNTARPAHGVQGMKTVELIEGRTATVVDTAHVSFFAIGRILGIPPYAAPLRRRPVLCSCERLNTVDAPRVVPWMSERNDLPTGGVA
jgi:hypothetical protein